MSGDSEACFLRSLPILTISLYRMSPSSLPPPSHSLSAPPSSCHPSSRDPSRQAAAKHIVTAAYICVLGVCAVAVNICSFALIGKAGPIAYAVVGHAKTCIVVLLVPARPHLPPLSRRPPFCSLELCAHPPPSALTSLRACSSSQKARPWRREGRHGRLAHFYTFTLTLAASPRRLLARQGVPCGVAGDDVQRLWGRGGHRGRRTLHPHRHGGQGGGKEHPREVRLLGQRDTSRLTRTGHGGT